jgi:CDP-glucose 4,6-dehydratase
VVIRPSFWRGRRVFVTGHTGFKGGWLTLWLTELGAEVTGYALAPATSPNLFGLARVGEGMRHIVGDVRDGQALGAALAGTRPEVVFHLAAQPLVRLSYQAPIETYETNVMGTAHLLEAVRRVGGVRAVVCVTSDKCYENDGEPRAFRENDAMGGHDPYSSSKGCAELVIAAYRRSYFPPSHLAEHGVGLASVRAGNVIGGGDWAADRLVPDIVRSFASRTAPVIRNPASVRPWQHVLEPLRGYLMLAERLHGTDADCASGWNFGPRAEDCGPVSLLAERLAAHWGVTLQWDTARGAQPHEAAHLSLDCAKADAELGWRPALVLEDALRLVAEWHKGHETGKDMREVTLEQISRYQSRFAPLRAELEA